VLDFWSVLTDNTVMTEHSKYADRAWRPGWKVR
jgi:hypothetical protein